MNVYSKAVCNTILTYYSCIVRYVMCVCVCQLRAQCSRKLSGDNRGQVWEIVVLTSRSVPRWLEGKLLETTLLMRASVAAELTV